MKLAALTLLTSGLLVPASGQEQLASMPPEFQAYTTWKPLLDSPYQVPRESAFDCMPPDRAAAQKKYGPHTRHYIQVYANETAAPAARRAAGRVFPVGSIVAKEKMIDMSSKQVDGVGFMVKRNTAEFRDSGGWEFLFFPGGGDARATHQSCAACHRAASSTDYVFGHYPRQE